MPKSRRTAATVVPPPGCLDAWQELRALHLGDDADWYRYIAGDPAEGQHVVRLTLDDGTRPYRTLERGEAYWWVLGMADGFGHGQQVDAIVSERVPPLVRTKDAAKQLGMSVNGIVYLIHGGELLALYGARKVRWLFSAQCEAVRLTRREEILAKQVEDLEATPGRRLAEARKALTTASVAATTGRGAWQRIREQLPAAIRPVAAGPDLTPGPSPDPLPVPRARPPAKRCIRALMLAEERKWLEYVQPNPEGTFTVKVDYEEGWQLERPVPAAGVLPYVLGLGDARGQGPAVAYRPGLGY